MQPFVLEPQSTALVLIDLQHGIVGLPTVPYSGREVVSKSARLANKFREKGAIVVYVRVDLGNMQSMLADASTRDPNAPPPPAIASELLPEAGVQPGDLIITKRHWGAFFGTDLEHQLRQRGIQTVVLGGIATNYGVESTARAAVGFGFDLVVVEDATTTLTAEAHRFAYENIFPRIGRVRSTEQVAESFA
jgi:nicotinamidase-related amidase